MCQRIELRKLDGSFDRMIDQAQGLADLVGLGNIIVYADDDEATEPFGYDGSPLTYCLCPFALEPTLERAGFSVEQDDLGDIIAYRIKTAPCPVVGGEGAA